MYEVRFGINIFAVHMSRDKCVISGHDTTASAISWVLYSIASSPEWQKKCQDEIDEILEDRDTDDLEW